MTQDLKINHELNLASSIVLLSVLNKKYHIQPEKIVLNNDGFYVQFFSNEKISSNDLDAIEKEVIAHFNKKNEIILSDTSYKFNKYEEYFIKEQKIQNPAIYGFDQQDFFSFNYSLQTPYNLNQVKFFKLLSLGGAKWLNDDKNENLIRISAIAFASKEEGQKFLDYYNDLKERDHRKIGEELKLFTFDNLAGQGLPIWLPRGYQIRYALEEFISKILFKYNFTPVATPILGSVDLYKTSGHYFHYKENMFPEIHLEDGESLMLRPMTCPHHVLVYKTFLNSYRDLPIRLSENSILHRYEASGGLTGLERVRMMDLADIHIFARHDQIKQEIQRTYEMVKEVHQILGIEFSSIDLSLHDPLDKEKFFDNPSMWKNAENQLRTALQELNIKFNEEVGEAAFYGPKIDFQAKTALGHIVTVSTIQLDFLLPDRFKLTYKDQNNNDEVPVMIHVSTIGTYERFVSVLLEQTKGKLPLWLSPDQVSIIPVNEQCLDYAHEVEKALRKHMIRTVVDDSSERLAKKIRNAQIQKIPYQLVLGTKEKQDHLVTVREYGKEETSTTTIDTLIDLLNTQIANYK